MLTANQVRVIDAIESQLVGESKETAQYLFWACAMFVSISNLTRRISYTSSFLLSLVLAGKDFGFLVSAILVFMCFVLVHIATWYYLVRRNRENLDMSATAIRYITQQGGSQSIVEWLNKRDQEIGKVIKHFATR